MLRLEARVPDVFWRAIGVVLLVGLVVVVGGCFYLHLSYPANSVLNDTTDKIAVCEEHGLRGGEMRYLKSGQKVDVDGISCAVLKAEGPYHGCLLLPNARNQTILVSTANPLISSSKCGPGWSPDLEMHPDFR
jgi:hypothetical protein